jgi:endonuclease-8
MPEGDTLLHVARALDRVLTGQSLEAVRAARPLGAYAPRKGARLVAVEARGKNLLLCFEGGPALHVHLGMRGRVHLYRPGERFQLPEWQASLVVEVKSAVAVVFRAALVRALRDPSVDRSLGELGPDVLADDFDADEACRRLRTLDPATPIGDALLDQRSLAGIGNVYKCEALFVCRIDPFAAISSIDDAALRHVVTVACATMRANVADASRVGPRRTRASRDPRSARAWVYGRAGRPCFECGELVRAKRAGPRARVTWYCPRCQGMAVSKSSDSENKRPGRTASDISSSSRRSSSTSRISPSAGSATARSKSRSGSR